MSNLKQNNLSEATTELGFVQTINANKANTTALQKEVTLEDGTKVIVEGITPSRMKQVLNSMVDGNEDAVTFETPGEDYGNRDGVVQIYNDSIIAPDLVSIAITTAPTKTTYVEGETFDSTGMVVTGTYSNTTTKVITDYTISPSGELATTDTSVTISYEGKTASQSITVSALAIESIAVTTPPTKVEYTVGEYFDPTGMVVTATWNNGNTSVVEAEDLTYSPDTETALTTEDTTITITDETEHTTTQAITVNESQL